MATQPSANESGNWLRREQVDKGMVGREVLVRKKSGLVSKGQILDVTLDREGVKRVKCSVNGRQVTFTYYLTDKVTDVALR
jgi:hypothetical protein